MLLSFLIPSKLGINIGSLSIYPYRLVFIALIPYLLWMFVSKRHSSRWLLCDTLAILVSIWPVFAFWLNTDIFRAIESGGVLALDIVIPYALVRLHVNSYRSRKEFAKLMFGFVAILFLISFPEAIFGRHFIQEFASNLVGLNYNTEIERRLGIWRAKGPMDHAILLGTSCITIFAVALMLGARQNKYWLYALFALGGAVITASSGPVLAIFVQFGMIVWASIFRGDKNKWLYLALSVVAAYILIDLASNRDPFRVMFTYLLLNPHNGYARYYMWIFSFETILDSGWAMLYGFGFNPDVFIELENRYWRTLLSATLDSYWLVIMMRFGFVGLILHLLFVLSVLKINLSMTRRSKIKKERRLLEAWFIAAFSITLVAATVHFWGRLPGIYMMVLAACIGQAKIRRKDSLKHLGAKYAT